MDLAADRLLYLSITMEFSQYADTQGTGIALREHLLMGNIFL